jgi:hypothetical protein
MRIIHQYYSQMMMSAVSAYLQAWQNYVSSQLKILPLGKCRSVSFL